MITRKRLRQLVHYDPLTGIFTWAMSRAKCRKGDRAGSSWKGKYERIRLDNHLYWSHALAFLYMTGRVPRGIDHENRDGNDNRWTNLREATTVENACNKGLTCRNKSGFIGVYQCSTTRRWVAQIRSNGRTQFLGRYDSPEEAAVVRDREASKQHGRFAVLNLPC